MNRRNLVASAYDAAAGIAKMVGWHQEGRRNADPVSEKTGVNIRRDAVLDARSHVWVSRFLLVIACFVVSGLCYAADTAPSSILGQYQQLRVRWIAAVAPIARNLFGALAMIEFAWSAALLLMEKSDFQSWTAGVVRKLMWIGAFYTLLIFGPTWIPAIVDSFVMIGQSAAGTGALAPGDVYTRGLEIAGNLLKGSSDAGFFTNFGSALSLVLAAFLAFLAFLVITVQFVVALVESYIVVSAGFLFLGFGGSRWTAPYVERYIGLAVSSGVKIMILYLLIGSGMTLSNGWLAAAVNVPGATSPSMSALDIVGAALIFMAVCWQSPKLIAGVIGGSPALSGGDVISAATTLAGAAYFASSAALSGGRAAATMLAGGGSGTTGSSGGSAGGAGGRGPTPSSGPSGGGGTTAPTAPPQPPPPASAGDAKQANGAPRVSPPAAPSGSGPDRGGHDSARGSADTVASGAAGSVGEETPGKALSYAKTAAVVRAVVPPSDAAPHSPPPRLQLSAEGGEE